MANFLYKIYFTVPDAMAPAKKERDMCITAPGPIRALDVFHRNVQTMKPLLAHTDYTVTKLVHRYKDDGGGLPSDGTGDWLEAAVDLPATPNPQIAVKAPETAPVRQVEMPLDDDRLQNAFGTDYEKANPKAI